MMDYWEVEDDPLLFFGLLDAWDFGFLFCFMTLVTDWLQAGR